MKPPPQAHGILAHYFTGPGYPPAQGALTVDEWEAGLDAYGPRLVPALEWIDRALSGKQKDECVVTFDDGLREAYVLAVPSLEKRGLTACFSIYTGPFVGVPNPLEAYRWLRNHAYSDVTGFYAKVRSIVRYPEAPDYLADKGYLTPDDRAFRRWRNTADRADYESVMELLLEEHAATGRVRSLTPWMSPHDVRDLHAKGHVIGFHTHSHPTDMTLLSRHDQAVEYATSRWIVGDLVGGFLPPTTMAHPCDTVTDWGLDWLRRNGIQIGWGGQVESTDLLRAPRWSTGYWAL